MLTLIAFRPLNHTGREYRFTQRRRYEGKMACSICRLRVSSISEKQARRQ